MSDQKIIRMANQIARFFASQKAETRVAGIAAHINDFWEPRMRAELFALAQAGGDDLDPLVMEAIVHIRPADCAD